MTANKHQLSRDSHGWRCAACGLTWKRQPSSHCAGVTVYTWKTVGDKLLTLKQMAARRLIPGEKRGAMMAKKGFVWLYDPAEGTPKPALTDKQKAAIVKMQAAARAARTCKGCGGVYGSKHDLNRAGLCELCAAEARRKNARTNAIVWANALLSDGDFVIVDTETSGLDSMAEILAITILDARGGVLLDTYVKPQEAIDEREFEEYDPNYWKHREYGAPPTAFGINGISNAMVADAPGWCDLYPRVRDLLHGKTVVAYNAEFDSGMIDLECKRHQLPYIEARWACAMLHYAAYVGDWNDYYGNYRWHKLAAAVRDLGGALENAHDAKADALGALAVIRGMAWKHRDAAWANELPRAAQIVTAFDVNGMIVGRNAYYSYLRAQHDRAYDAVKVGVLKLP